MSTKATARQRATGTTDYSRILPGDDGNYGWAVQLDLTDGYLGINQDADRGLNRVLLSPAQVRELIAFVSRG